MPTVAANSFTTLHTTFSVIPPPQTEPVLVTQRKILPAPISATLAHASIEALTHSGTGTVLM